MSEKDDFLEAHKKFSTIHEFVPKIFKFIASLNVEPRRAWANLLFMRLGMVGFSLLTLCMLELDNQNDLEHGRVSALDHSSIAALARTLLEAWIMFVYMSEPAISDDEWSLRRSILELHDSTARYRIAKDIGDAEEAQNFKLAKDATKRRIIFDPLFQNLDGERQEKLLGGQELYIKGLRAVVKEAGWNIDYFNAMYNILSSHAHSAPVSFYRSVIDPFEPAPCPAPEYQYLISGQAFEYATACLDSACQRMFALYPELFLRDKLKH